MSAISLFDLNGEQRFTGTSVGGGGAQTLEQVLLVGNDAGGNAITDVADPTDNQDAATKAYVLANAGSAPVQAVYSGNNVTVLNAAYAVPTVDTLVSGTALLNISDPAVPTIVQAGTYAFTAQLLTTEPLTADGYALGAIAVPTLGDAGESYHPDWGLSLGAVLHVAAGAGLNLAVANFDGAASRDFYLAVLIVVKLSST